MNLRLLLIGCCCACAVILASVPAVAASVLATDASAASPAEPVTTSRPQSFVVAPVKPFPQAVSITYLYQGLPIPGHLKWQMVHGRYELEISAALFGRTRAFTSAGRVGKHGLQPERFADIRDGALKNEALFDWSSHILTLHEGDKSTVNALHSGDQDMFSTAFQFAMHGLRDKQAVFSISTGRKTYDNVVFTVIDEKTWHVADQSVIVVIVRGTFEDRVFDFWLAPQWSNLPVRMVLNMGDNAPLDLQASRITIDGNTVLTAPEPTYGERPHAPTTVQ